MTAPEIFLSNEKESLSDAMWQLFDILEGLRDPASHRFGNTQAQIIIRQALSLDPRKLATLEAGNTNIPYTEVWRAKIFSDWYDLVQPSWFRYYSLGNYFDAIEARTNTTGLGINKKLYRAELEHLLGEISNDGSIKDRATLKELSEFVYGHSVEAED